MSRVRRVRPILALALLDTLRLKDRPEEFLMQEDPSVTLPRRLGLSTVIRSQIDRYQQAVKTREQLREDEVVNLVSLVLRRDDAEQVLHTVGERLASDSLGDLGWRRGLPRSLRIRAGRRQVCRALRALFPDLSTKTERGLLVISGSDHFPLRAAPEGRACEIISGFSAHGMGRLLGDTWRTTHDRCVGRGDADCRWTVRPSHDSGEVDDQGG